MGEAQVARAAIRAEIKTELDRICAELSTPDSGWGYSESLLDMLTDLAEARRKESYVPDGI